MRLWTLQALLVRLLVLFSIHVHTIWLEGINFLVPFGSLPNGYKAAISLSDVQLLHCLFTLLPLCLRLVAASGGEVGQAQLRQ